MYKVKSGAITSLGHDPETGVLEVEFRGGRVYRYSDVSVEKLNELLAAESIGKHFAAHIKPHHPCLSGTESEKP